MTGNGQPLQALGPALLGLRQVAASLLWVKTDDYFHEGQYEPILRMDLIEAARTRLETGPRPSALDLAGTVVAEFA